MTTVKFVQDFRGKLTKEVFYKSGDIASFDDAIAQVLLAENRVVSAEVVEVVEVVEEPKTESKRKRKSL